MNFVDPTGMAGEDWVKRDIKGGTEYFFDPDVEGKEATESKHGKGSHVENGSSLIGSSSKGENYRYTFNGDGTYSKDGSIVNNRTKTEGGSTIYEYCSSCLDPRTLYKQFGGIGGLTYPGGDNPKAYSGKDDYSFIPSSLIEFPAMQHDLAYDKLGITGASGLLMNRSAISADWTFVNQHLFLSRSGFLSPADRFKSDLLGFGLGLAATPKTLLNVVLPSRKYSHPYTPEQQVLINIGMSNFR